MQDYQNTENDDLLFEDGDLVVHDATRQHQEDILIAGKGNYRQFPDVGVDVLKFLDDDTNGDLPFVIRREFEKDGMTIQTLEINSDGSGEIIATYE